MARRTRQHTFLLLIMVSCAVQPLFVSCYYPYAGSYGRSLGYSSGEVTRLPLCVKYKAQYGWSKGYSVNANVMKGSVLNSKTRTYNYNAYSTYAVIFWDDNEASIIELTYFYGSFSAYGITGKDQQGREWELSQSDYCY